MTDELSDRLRESFRRQADSTPPPKLSPYAVMRHGQRLRRVRRGAVVCAAAASVIVVLSGAVMAAKIVIHNRPRPEPAASVPAHTVGTPQVAVLVGDFIRLPDGTSLELPARGGDEQPWDSIAPVAGGWVVNNSLRAVVVGRDHSVRFLLAGNMKTSVVRTLPSPDGQEIAVYTHPAAGKGKISILETETLVEVAKTDTEDFEPYQWIGTDLVLGAPPQEDDFAPRRVSRWNPAAGAWKRELSGPTAGVIGSTVEGAGTTKALESVLAFRMSATRDLCLGYLNLESDKTTREKCVGHVGDPVFAELSPRRDRLVMGTAGGAGEASGVRVLRVTAKGVAVERTLRLPVNMEGDHAVWESEKVVSMHMHESQDTSRRIVVARCDVDTGACVKANTAAAGSGYVVISRLTPPDAAPVSSSSPSDPQPTSGSN